MISKVEKGIQHIGLALTRLGNVTGNIHGHDYVALPLKQIKGQRIHRPAIHQQPSVQRNRGEQPWDGHADFDSRDQRALIQDHLFPFPIVRCHYLQGNGQFLKGIDPNFFVQEIENPLTI